MKVSAISLLLIGSMAFGQVATLTRVVDGDTVYFSNGDKCRIGFIDTPESKQNGKASRDASKCNGLTVDTIVDAGKASSDKAKSLLNIGSSYRYDVIGSDQYDRSICVLKMPNGSTFNQIMVQTGYAVPFGKYIKDQGDYRLYYGAMRDAKQHNAGLWASNRPVMQCMESIDE
ncbi:MAG: thermonuclease family protein [Paludibacter sp.]|nr:thermonuclease family protein [Paludibacter sp.]